MNAERGSRRPYCRRTIAARCWALTLLALLALPAVASASSVTDVGEGFPLSMNSSDEMVVAQPVLEAGEENIEGPWSIWSAGKSTVLTPYNGGPEENSCVLGSVCHDLSVLQINDAGRAAGTSSMTYTDEKGTERSVERAVWFSPTGEAHLVPLLQETVKTTKGTKPAGAIGVGIDAASDVVGFGAVEVGEKIRARGFLSAGGTGAAAAVGTADGPWTEVYAVNSAGMMYGKASEVNAENTPINPKWYVWSSPSSAGTPLNFDTQLVGHPLGNDGSVLGYRAGTLYLRAPGGVETPVTGLSKPFALNASHEIVGSETVKGAEHAAVWREGTVTDVNTLLPEKSGWVLQRALAINDKGDIAGIGIHEGHQHVFLLQGGLLASISGAPSVALPEEGTTEEEFTVSLSEESTTEVTVKYQTQDGTATTANNDYTAASGTLSFPPGVTSQKIKVQIDAGDGNDSTASETYQVRLTGTPTAGVVPAAATATGTVGLPGIGGTLVTGPPSGAAKPLAPAAGVTVQVTGKSATGRAVSETVTTNAFGDYSASVDAGTYSVTPTTVPAGQPAGFTWSPSAHCPGKRKAAVCENVVVKSANGKLVQSEVGFGYGQRDPQVENVEIIQGAQLKNWDKPAGEITIPGTGKVSADEYSGVGLAADSPAVVRLYASNKGPGAAQGVPARLAGYKITSAGLIALPGSPLSPANPTLDALPEPVVDAEHADASATFNFQIPASWTHGAIALVGTVDPAQDFPECAGCRANDNLALTNVPFTEVPAFKFTPMSLDWTEGTTVRMPSNPVAAVTRTWPYWPLPTNGLIATGAPIHVDLTAVLASVAAKLRALPKYRGVVLRYNTKSLVGCLGWNAAFKLDADCVNMLEGKLFAAEKAAFGSTPPADPTVGVYDDTGVVYGVIGAANKIPGSFSYVPDSAGRSGTVVHEMLHELGFKHSGCTGPTDEEPWPANSQGQASLVGFGEDRSLTSEAGIGPILFTAGTGRGQGTHDIMSYCDPTWPSSFNWDRVLARLTTKTLPQPYGAYPAYNSLTAETASAGAAGHGAVVTVEAVPIDGSPVIADVLPGAIGEAGEEASPLSAEVLNARGRVIARAPIRVSHTHADVIGPNPATSLPDDHETMQVVLPASGAASIAIVKGGHVLTSTRLPRGKLRLKLGTPSRSMCRRRGALSIPYSVAPAGGSFVHVAVSALVGHGWRTIEIGAQARRIVLPAGTRPHGARKLRVTYDNGVSSVTRTLLLAASCRAG
jgi:hypothetical protein